MGLRGFEVFPFGPHADHAVVDEVADVSDAGLHDLADLLVAEIDHELQPHGLSLFGG